MSDLHRFSAYDGRKPLGSIVQETRTRFVARDAAGKRLGAFATRREAMAAINLAAAPGGQS